MEETCEDEEGTGEPQAKGLFDQEMNSSLEGKYRAVSKSSTAATLDGYLPRLNCNGKTILEEIFLISDFSGNECERNKTKK